MRRTARSLTLLVLTALVFVAGALQARSNRAALTSSNPDLICGPSFCAQLVPFRVGMSRYEAPPESGS